MLEIKYVRQNIQEIQKALNNRGDSADLETFQKCDENRRVLLLEAETLRNRRNVVSEQIAQLKRQRDNADDLVSEMREVSSRIKELDKSLSKNEALVNEILIGIPNIPHASVPVGKNEMENKIIKKQAHRLILILSRNPTGQSESPLIYSILKGPQK